jgi:tetratricopeptide (TPR) repeat protein
MNAPQSQQVITLTNQAACLIDEREYADAFSILKEALIINRDFLNSVDEAARKKSPRSNSDLLEECMQSLHMKQHFFADDSDDFIYRSPIRIPEGSQTNHTDYNFHVTLSVLLVFNLALAHHLCGLEGTTRADMLEKAVYLYTLSQQIFEQQGLDTIAFILAVTNNIGQIRKTLGQTEVADELFQRMLTTLLYLNQYLWDTKEFSLEGFFRNTTHLVLTNSHTAKAA